MDSIVKHIEYYYPNPVFSEVKYLTSANGVIQANYSPHKARAVLLLYLYLDFDSAKYGNVTFYDSNVALFTISSTSTSLYVPIYRIIVKGDFKVTCNAPTLSYAISHQYILEDEKADGK